VEARAEGDGGGRREAHAALGGLRRLSVARGR
jgi:hypothetical protein